MLHFFRCPVSLGSVTHLTLLAACFAMLDPSLTAWAGVATYNPDHLSPTQLERVSDICQAVMGLSANEPLSGGDWLGEPRLDYESSPYRVCIISLSDSLQRAADAQLVQAVDADCRSKGFVGGSADLALCVLQDVNERAGQSQSTQPTAGSSSHSALPQALTSYYRASSHDRLYREQLACASLGLEPAPIAFESCTKNFNHTLYSIENPVH